jgi:serine/threonine protein kinase
MNGVVSPRDDLLSAVYSPRGRYTIIRKIGEGSFSDVFLAHREEEDKVVVRPRRGTPRYYAVKRMDLSESTSAGATTLITLTRETCETEVAIMRRVAHPNVVKLLDDFIDGRYFCVVMEHAAGGDMLGLVNRCGHLLETKAKVYVAQLALALHYAHGLGFVHRDVKLENILLDIKSERIMLADWGFACCWSPQRRIEGSVGSLNYSSPELVQGSSYVGPEIDSWSLGVVLYAMLEGRLPFTPPSTSAPSNLAEVRRRIAIGAYVSPARASGPCLDLVRRLLWPNPANRASMRQVLDHSWMRERDYASTVACMMRVYSEMKIDAKLARTRSDDVARH